MSGVRIDFREVHRLAVTLDAAANVAPDEARKVVARGALQIKNGMRSRVQGLAHAPAYPYSITYDTKLTPAGAEAEIGPDKAKRQGALGNLINYGSVNNGPIPHVEPAAADEQPRFEKAMQDLAEKALGDLR